MGSPLQVAVFPLPKIVAFPGHSLQFHIFETRYRRMVRDCQENGTWLGVAQGDLLKKGRLGQTLDEFLNTNQELYSPVEVFGVGPMRVVKELPDGRFVIEVDIQARVRLRERVQELPYILVEAEALADDFVSAEEEARLLAELKTEIGRIASLRMGLLKHLQSKEYFDDTSVTSLVYTILKWFVIEDHEGQSLLEDNNPVSRAEKLLTWMRYFVSEASVHVVRHETKAPAPPASRGRKGRESEGVEEEASENPKRRKGASSRPPLSAAGRETLAPAPLPTAAGAEGGRVLHVDFKRKHTGLEID